MQPRDQRYGGLSSRAVTAAVALFLFVSVSAQSNTNSNANTDAGDSSILTAEEILLKVYSATGGLRWTERTNWLQSPDVCSFYGVTCYDPDVSDQARRGHIQELDLSDNHLVGTIPNEVFHLPFLESLVVRDNGDLFMDFAEIGLAQYLTNLVISDTHIQNLDGIEQATSLEILHITSLGIGGNIPAGLFQLTNLKGLFANFNSFTGKLPSDLGNLSMLTELYLFENDLTGQIPTQIGLLSNAKTLSLGQNAFSGNLPTELNKCTKLIELAVERAAGSEKGLGISGSLPSLNALTEIVQVYLDHQKLTGPIPDDFLASAPIQQVVTVDLTNNEISGAVPDSLTKFQRMILYLADNKIDSRTDSFCSKISGWMGGDVGDFLGCDAFLCPKGTAATDGRKTAAMPCQACADAPYFGSSSCSTTSSGDVNERAILVSFYNKVGGRYWKQSDNWLNPAEPVCNWYGIDCTSDGKVSAINLKNNDLTDTPPVEVFTLPELKILDLSSNSINFKFTGIDKATKLEILDLTQCDLESLAGIENIKSTVLRKLSVASNYLEGVVPSGLFLLTSLQELDISHNRFTGVLSTLIGNLINLVRFRCFGNKFSGQIPSQIGNLVRLIDLMAAENDFSGVLPSTLNSLTNLETLSLHQTTSSSGIGGPLLPLTNLGELTSLQLDGNALTGELPQSLLENTLRGNDRIELLLSNNRFVGTIPSNWASRFGRLVVDLSGNQITGIGNGLCNKGDWMDGTVGRFQCEAILCGKGTFNEFGKQSSVAGDCRSCPQAQFFGARECGGDTGSSVGGDEIDILGELFASTHGNNWNNSAGWQSTQDYCGWFGVGCNSNGKVVKISLGENGLTGTPPSSVFKLPWLRELNLERNVINFSFDGISQATNLAVLHLSGINLNSVVGIGEASSLVELHLTDNDLVGSIPDEVFELTNLRQLFLNFNNLEGRIPASISALRNLEELFLFSNRLGGQLPAALGSLSNLRTLALSENNFVGSLPPELNDLTKLEVLAIQREGGTNSTASGNVGVNQEGSDDEGTGLTGPLLAFDKLSMLKQLFLGVNSLSGSIPSNFLDGIDDKSEQIEVDLVSNRLSGPLPASLVRFDRLTLYVADNQITDIPDGICRKGSWMMEKVSSAGCNAILCPPGFFSVYGREADTSSKCAQCPQGESAPFYGSFVCQTQNDQDADYERAILEEFYLATDGDNWEHSEGWMDPDLSVCDWHGVACTSGEMKSVESIHLMQNGLFGNVSGSIYELQNLEEINLALNDVSLSFSGINKAQNLEYINLGSTGLKSLSGIERVPNLKLLHIVDNDFGGTFPFELSLLPSLQVLFLSENSIGSTLPLDVEKLTNLVFFSCSRCGLGGSLPSLLGSLSKLEYLQLDQNAFEGVISADIQLLVSLKHLDLSKQISSGDRGGLDGSIPSFSNFTQLNELFLNDNRFQGSLPDDFLQRADNSGLVTVDLRSNMLTGAIPVGLSRFDELNIDLGDNLIGTLPAQELCAKSWNDKSAGTSDCDFILCDVGSANGLGRATSGLPCHQCSREGEAPTYGSTECGLDDEKETLEMMYRELNGVGWVHSDGWTSHDHHCTWYGITCYDTGIRNQAVQAIDLSTNNLKGTLPASIWNLVHMTELNLRENSVDVSFAGIGNAQSLKSLLLSQTNVKTLNGIGAAISLEALHLTSNDIPGPLPDELFRLNQLERLFLNFNMFTGTLPTLIGQLTRLSELYMFNNALNGTIPTEIGRPFKIKVISLGENNFSGEIPRSLSFLPFLEVLSLQQEKRDLTGEVAGIAKNPGLSGNLPQFHRVSKLRELYLGSNSIGGTIPSTFLSGVSSKDSTIRVDLTSNSIHGTIPESLAAFDDLRLFVADNLIHDIPSEICSKGDWMDGLLASGCDALLCPPGMFNAYGRRINSEPCQTCDHRGSALWYGSTFCGALLPETLTEKEILEEIFSATDGPNWKDKTNWMSGSVCSWKGISCESDAQGDSTVTEIDLSSNSLKGYVPSIVFYLPSLRSLNVGGNEIVISFRDIEDAASLEELYFYSTKVVSIEGIGQATNLRTLKMFNNAFFGRSLPDELFALTNLETLDISRNGFVGTLSPMIERLTKLENFRGGYNDLSGEIPSSIGMLRMLQELTLEENNFFGTLPPSLEDLSSLKTISLQGHTRTTAGLSGPPLSFAKSSLLRYIDLGSNSLTGTIPSNLLLAVTSSQNDRITVQLDSNLLTGSVPSDLSLRFSQLNIDLTGNQIEGIPEGLCNQIPQWMDGDVGRFSCRGLLCPKGTFNEFGRQTSEESRCETCPEPDNSYLGNTICPSILKVQTREILENLFRETGGSNWKRKDGWLNQNEDICDWYGITCRDNVAVESIILGSNNLVGTPPKEVFEIFGLKTLWLYSNPIDFSFTGIEKATTLRSLQLDSTGLKSLNGIANCPSLVDVDVRFNQLSGPLTNEIASLANLETFFCGDNDLSGPLPSFETNRKMTTLRVGGNKFSGRLPSFDVHPNLKTLDVSNNQLDGEIPNDFLEAADASKPIFIDISSNFISGTIPGSLSRLSEVTLYARDNRIQGIHPDLCLEDSWNGGDVGLFGCDAILCPPSSYSPLGRASEDSSTCLPCKQTVYFGRSECSKLRGGSSAWSSYLLSRFIVGIATLGLWVVL